MALPRALCLRWRATVFKVIGRSRFGFFAAARIWVAAGERPYFSRSSSALAIRVQRCLLHRCVGCGLVFELIEFCVCNARAALLVALWCACSGNLRLQRRFATARRIRVGSGDLRLRVGLATAAAICDCAWDSRRQRRFATTRGVRDCSAVLRLRVGLATAMTICVCASDSRSQRRLSVGFATASVICDCAWDSPLQRRFAIARGIRDCSGDVRPRVRFTIAAAMCGCAWDSRL